VRHRWAGYILALLVGLAFTAWLFPRQLLFPPNYYDVAELDDTAHPIIGQRYFLLEQWHMPPLQARLLRWPKGTNIGLTDSIPLLAIPAKLLRRILPAGFHTIFWFLAIAWCLQPVAAVFALRSAGEKRLLPSLAMAVIALSMPTLFFRSLAGHEALCGHFLIFLAIGLYFRISQGSRIATWLGPPALLVASLLVHPYLMAMIAAVLMAAPISLLMRRDALRLPVSVAFITAIAISGGLALLLGYAEEAGVGGAFGYYSMNLLSPIDPAGSTLIPFFPTLMDATGGQNEGYQYLGVGVLLLCLTALICICVRAPKRVCARHSGLLVVSMGLILYALSNSVYNGTFLVFHFEGVPSIVQSFRSSGRFFWPVAYLLVIGSIATVVRRLPAKSSATILLIAAGLQFADTTALRNKLHDHLRRTEKWYIDRDSLGMLMQHSDRLTVWPRYECRGSVVFDPQYLQVLLLASKYGLRTNTMFTPNPKLIGPCRAGDVMGTPLQAGELRIILSTGTFDNVLPPNSRELCHQIGHLTACAAGP
jgi:hypothetical protein